MNHMIAVNSNCYHGYSIEEAIDGISSAGFHYIELSAAKGWTEHIFPTMSSNYLNTVKGRLTHAGLVPFAMGGLCNLMDKEHIGDFLANIRLASFFGCDYIVSSIGEAQLKDQAAASNEDVAEHIRELLPYLEEYDLQLVLENHGQYATGQMIKSIVDLIDSPRVAINYNTANVIYFAGVNPLKDMKTCIDKIGYMHIKDKIGGRHEWNFPPLGQGTINFPAILDLLKKADNSCPLSIEIEFTKTGSKDLLEVNRAVKTSYYFLQGLGLKF